MGAIFLRPLTANSIQKHVKMGGELSQNLLARIVADNAIG